MNKRLLLLPLALLLLLGLAACGGGGESGGGEDEAKIEAVIKESVTIDDPAKCTELMTQPFVEQTASAKGAEAIEQCEAEAKNGENDAKSVKVTEVEVDGETATAHTAFVGGGFNGQTLLVALVKEGGQWKLDQIEEFVELDKEALAKVFEEQLEGTGQVPAAVIACIAGKLREASQEELEVLLFGGSTQGFVELAKSCE